jgi:P-type conjugative transfer protein TrbJ
MKSRIIGAALACAAIATTALTPIAPVQAAMPVVDVKAVAQMLKQVQQATQQLATLKSQLTNQTRMLNKIGVNISPELTGILNDATSIMRSANGIGYNAKNMTSQIEQIYPRDLLGSSWNQISSQQNDWETRTRDTRREALEAQSAIAQSQGRTQSAVERAVQASQNADGQTGAIQATNQLLAALSAQLTGLQTLLITQMRTVETANEQRAAETAAANARHKKIFGNPADLPKFGNGYGGAGQ